LWRSCWFSVGIHIFLSVRSTCKVVNPKKAPSGIWVTVCGKKEDLFTKNSGLPKLLHNKLPSTGPIE
jgi:hypothetical protein